MEKMNGKKIVDIGFEKVEIGVALKLAESFLDEASALLALTELFDAPEKIFANPSASDEAVALAKLVITRRETALKHLFVERNAPAPWRVWGEDIEGSALAQMRNAARLPVAVAGALMPDAHLGYGLPIGGVLATENSVIPYAVGVDIACRMMLTVTDVSAGVLDGAHEKDFWSALREETFFGTGKEVPKEKQRDHEVMDSPLWDEIPMLGRLRDKAYAQRTTSGSGNHFVEWGSYSGESGTEKLALLSHSGSRGLGANICKHYSKIAANLHPELPKPMQHLAWLDISSEAGQEYWLAMNLAGEYASSNHHGIHARLVKRMKLETIFMVENHHNFCFLEKHNGQDLYVHRKGATPAGAGVLGVIPGTMGDVGYVVRGRGNAESLESASHGAGRAMSRTKAKEQFSNAMMQSYLKERKVKLLDGGVDESPFAYKRIETVMAAQKDLVEVIGEFRPRVVMMASSGERPED